jgi:V/A-type H+-transporting ATPase subunit I
MKKVTFLGLEDEKEKFVKRLQEVGITHVDIPKDGPLPADTVKELQKVNEIRKFLSRIAAKEQPQAKDSPQDYAEICARRDALGQKETRLQTEISALKKEQALLEPWGDFNPEDILMLRSKGLNIQFYRIPRRIFGGLALDDIAYQITHETEGELCVLVLTMEPAELGIPEEKVPLKSLSRIGEEIREKEEELQNIAAEYKELSAHTAVLAQAEDMLTDTFEYRRVVMNAVSELEGKLFVLTCWSPVPEEELVKRIGEDFTISHFGDDPEPGDRVPVLLRNGRTADAGEDLVKVYSQPNYTDFDPSGFVLYWFVLFYGMIIGDAGYGVSLLALNIFLHVKVKSTSPMWIRLRRLNYMLSLAVIFFGIISVSYFGVSIPPESPLNKCMLLNLGTKEGQNFVMLVAIVIGMIHISLALAIKFYRTRDLPSLGWIFVIWSGYVILSASEGAPMNPAAKWVMIGGLGVVILFSSSHRNPIIRVLIGLNASLGIIQLFADILSYMRLFALGLATMYMCQTFNMLANMAYQALPPYIGFLPAVLILIVGHSINIVLGIMGGVVHGLRLNFLEWYRWCFEGDGLPFKPFRLVTVEKF